MLIFDDHHLPSSGNDTSAQNNWKGAWWQRSLSVQSGFVEEDGPYASNGQKEIYPLFRSLDFHRMHSSELVEQPKCPQHSGTLLMETHGMDQGHFSINCDWVSMDIPSGKSLLTKTASSGSLWDAASAFSLLFSLISLCLSVFIAYRIFGPKSVQYKPMEISLG
ncbi:hypothetical protein CRG98_043528 [Punica granatum]|uniref:Uncharacterized protein n=1 Tax=Punica granatum TaxID=22663 RepID=A0A2I0HWH5_PUNGR|nr:hypothetical protein CRG98_043528 [Punica granatum]